MTHRWRFDTRPPRLEKKKLQCMHACMHAWCVVMALCFMSYLLMLEGGSKAGLDLVVPMWPWCGSGGHEAPELIYSYVLGMRSRWGHTPTCLPHIPPLEWGVHPPRLQEQLELMAGHKYL